MQAKTKQMSWSIWRLRKRKICSRNRNEAMPGIRDIFSSLAISTMTHHHLGDLGHPACSTRECGHEGANRQARQVLWEVLLTFCYIICSHLRAWAALTYWKAWPCKNQRPQLPEIYTQQGTHGCQIASWVLSRGDWVAKLLTWPASLILHQGTLLCFSGSQC